MEIHCQKPGVTIHIQRNEFETQAVNLSSADCLHSCQVSSSFVSSFGHLNNVLYTTPLSACSVTSSPLQPDVLLGTQRNETLHGINHSKCCHTLDASFLALLINSIEVHFSKICEHAEMFIFVRMFPKASVFLG
jgi:hypothetical protein